VKPQFLPLCVVNLPGATLPLWHSGGRCIIADRGGADYAELRAVTSDLTRE